MYVLGVVIIAVLSILSAWFVGVSQPRERPPTKGRRVLGPAFAGLKLTEPPWKVGTVWATLALVLFIAIGVVSSWVVVGEEFNVCVSLIIAVLLAGTTYFARSKKKWLDIGDFFNCFTQGFTWPTAMPKLFEFLQPPVPPPAPTPTPTGLLHSIASVMAAAVESLLSLLT